MSESLTLPPSDGGDAIGIWHRILSVVLAMPGARVDRASFLRRALSPHFPDEVVQRAIDTRPACAGIPLSAIQGIARSSIAWHRGGVTATSVIVSLPGGWWMAGTIPADLAQYFWHVLVVLQKLAYLYGWPSLWEHDGELDDESLLIFSVFVGVMLGAGSAAKVLGEIADRISQEVVRKLPQKALTKWGSYRLAKRIAQSIGEKMTKDRFAAWLGKAIPLLSGIISGGITWVTFSLGAKRLRRHLERLRLARE